MSPHPLKQEEDKQLVGSPLIMYVGQDLEGFATDSFMGGGLGVDAAVCRLT